MSNHTFRTMPAYVPEALAASNVGTWQTGETVHHYIVDEAGAALFGLDAARAAEGILLTDYSRAVHRADRKLFYEKIERATKQGGLFFDEYRTTPRHGVMRWVLARGRYERNPSTGAMQGRGILIDITESKLDWHGEDRAFVIEPYADDPPLDRAATLAIETRRAVDEIEGPGGPALRQAVDALLWAVGHALARRDTDTTG